MNNIALIVFTRNPELGKCKTRLASAIGDEAALRIYEYLLKHTAEISKQVLADRYVFYSENICENDLWDKEHFNKRLQNGEDLGERMLNAFKYVFGKGHSKVIIIGSDLLDLEADIVVCDWSCPRWRILFIRTYVIERRTFQRQKLGNKHSTR
jgi:glycosyltransferase A (GT-A) superfamily protein (DUF2064 family)